jgi:small subunit ribosomal protein S17
MVTKFNRGERRRSRVSAHIPPCIEVKDGDSVMLGECRPLSKTMSFVVVEAKRGS